MRIYTLTELFIYGDYCYSKVLLTTKCPYHAKKMAKDTIENYADLFYIENTTEAGKDKPFVNNEDIDEEVSWMIESPTCSTKITLTPTDIDMELTVADARTIAEDILSVVSKNQREGRAGVTVFDLMDKIKKRIKYFI